MPAPAANLTQIRHFLRTSLGDLRGFDVYATLDGRAMRYTRLMKNARLGDTVEVSAYGPWEVRELNVTLNSRDVLDVWEDTAEERARAERRRERSKKIRDFQRSKVYAWESVAWDKRESKSVGDRLACQTLVSEIFDTYGLSAKTPTVEVKRALKRTSYYQSYGNRIALAESWGTRRSTVIHEAVHGLIQHGVHERVAAHGGEFVAILAECYDLFLGDDRPDGMTAEKSLAIAEERGIVVAHGLTLSPR